MRILFDQGTPVPLRRHLPAHVVETAYERGWAELDNGDLLNAAEGFFDVLITTDQNLCHQQRIAGRPLAVLVLMTTSWPRIEPHADQVAATIEQLQPGESRELKFPA
jgi:predicted nuclease of predicted toxin-antitoxin system